jgi:hypothetical protein
MGKLFDFKEWLEWLTLADAAKYLSKELNCEVTVADVLQLALVRRLRLSVRFVNGVMARGCTVIQKSAFKFHFLCELGDVPERQFFKVSFVFRENTTVMAFSRESIVGNGNFLEIDNFVTPLSGVCDLPMIGNEMRNVEQAFQRLTNGPAVVVDGPDAAFVKMGGRLYQLQDHDRPNQIQVGGSKQYRPAQALPNDAVFVVRTETLRKIVQAINDASSGQEKPLNISERNSLLTIIAGLCDYSDIKHHERGAATQIAKFTEEIGAPVSDDTVRRALAKIPDALKFRMN